MLCIYCDSDTKVVNSRLKKRNNQVWRRRQCIICQAVFTTSDSIHYEAAWMVLKADSGAISHFMPDKLTLSLYKSLQHREKALSEAADLCDTIMQKLRPHVENGVVNSRDIVRIAEVSLNRFDSTASVHYAAFHRT